MQSGSEYTFSFLCKLFCQHITRAIDYRSFSASLLICFDVQVKSSATKLSSAINFRSCLMCKKDDKYLDGAIILRLFANRK